MDGRLGFAAELLQCVVELYKEDEKELWDWKKYALTALFNSNIWKSIY